MAEAVGSWLQSWLTIMGNLTGSGRYISKVFKLREMAAGRLQEKTRIGSTASFVSLRDSICKLCFLIPVSSSSSCGYVWGSAIWATSNADAGCWTLIPKECRVALSSSRILAGTEKKVYVWENPTNWLMDYNLLSGYELSSSIVLDSRAYTFFWLSIFFSNSLIYCFSASWFVCRSLVRLSLRRCFVHRALPAFGHLLKYSRWIWQRRGQTTRQGRRQRRYLIFYTSFLAVTCYLLVH